MTDTSGTVPAHDADPEIVTVERTINADAATIFGLLADPAKHPLIDGSGSVRKVRGNPDRLTKGAKFGMDMRIGVPYRITNTVVEFDEGRRIAWRHFAGHVWRYILEPVDGGTKVTEQFDMRPSRSKLILKLIRAAENNRKSMEQTLERIDREVSGKSA